MTTHLFVGDSITDANRLTDPEGLGSGYVRLLAHSTGATVVNRGVSGDRAVDLEARWERDVLSLAADTVTIYVGVNDMWRRFDSGLETPAADFAATYRRLLGALPEGRRIVLIEPFYLTTEPDRQTWLEDLAGKRDVVRTLATENGAAFLALHEIMTRAAAASSIDAIAPDGVHPSDAGHRIIADAWLALVASSD